MTVKDYAEMLGLNVNNLTDSQVKALIKNHNAEIADKLAQAFFSLTQEQLSDFAESQGASHVTADIKTQRLICDYPDGSQRKHRWRKVNEMF
jgi:hypothetical protein